MQKSKLEDNFPIHTKIILHCIYILFTHTYTQIILHVCKLDIKNYHPYFTNLEANCQLRKDEHAY